MPNDRRARDALAYWVGFSHVPGIGPVRLARLVARAGGVAAAWHAPAHRFRDLLDAATVAALEETRHRLDLDETMRRLADGGIRAVSAEMPAYPDCLRTIDAAPFVLYVRGDPAALRGPSIAVVGTRTATPYGLRVGRAVGAGLARSGVTVVSGAAFGVDTVAHRACLDTGGTTVAVMGCGVDVEYPVRNRALRRDIAASGALVSELPPGTPPARGHFPARNRIVSGLAVATVVVEAGARSGAIGTARHAAEQGREVFAVPGSLFSPRSVGTHRLIAAGAALFTDVPEMLRVLGLPVAEENGPPPAARPENPVESALAAVLDDEPRHVDELCRASGLTSRDVARALTYMELKGMARHMGHMKWTAGP